MNWMRDSFGSVIWVEMALTVLLSSEIVAQVGTTTRPASGHPIYGISEVLPDDVRLKKHQGQEIFLARVKFPEWTFALAKKDFILGEPITGQITVRNRSEEFSFVLSRPYIGAMNCTVGVWISRKTDAPEAQWTDPQRVLLVNGGDIRAGARQGPPFLLMPGKAITQALSLNYLPTGTELAGRWLPVGFSSPGTYRIYVKYVNLERLIPYANTSREVVREKERNEPGDPILLPSEPIVLGPFEVRVLPLENEQAQKHLTAAMRVWERASVERNRDLQETVTSESLAIIMTGLAAKEGVVRDSLVLGRIRHDLPQVDRSKTELGRLLSEVREVSAGRAAGPLRDALAFTECCLLDALGRRTEAMALAEKIGSPDTDALVAKWKKEKK